METNSPILQEAAPYAFQESASARRSSIGTLVVVSSVTLQGANSAAAAAFVSSKLNPSTITQALHKNGLTLAIVENVSVTASLSNYPDTLNKADYAAPRLLRVLLVSNINAIHCVPLPTSSSCVQVVTIDRTDSAKLINICWQGVRVFINILCPICAHLILFWRSIVAGVFFRCAAALHSPAAVKHVGIITASLVLLPFFCPQARLHLVSFGKWIKLDPQYLSLR